MDKVVTVHKSDTTSRSLIPIPDDHGWSFCGSVMNIRRLSRKWANVNCGNCIARRERVTRGD